MSENPKWVRLPNDSSEEEHPFLPTKYILSRTYGAHGEPYPRLCIRVKYWPSNTMSHIPHPTFSFHVSSQESPEHWWEVENMMDVQLFPEIQEMFQELQGILERETTLNSAK